MNPTTAHAPPLQTRGVVLRKAAAVYDWLSPAMMFFQDGRINRHAADALELHPSLRVLDLGCASGGMTLEVARRLRGYAGGMAVGLDASEEMVAVARRKLGRSGHLPCRFDLAAAERLPYENDSFDRVVSTMFFHHLCLEDKLAALREARRVLRPGGRAVVVDVAPPTNWLGRLCARGGQWIFRQSELQENIDGKLPELFGLAGFSYRVIAHDQGYISTYALVPMRVEKG